MMKFLRDLFRKPKPQTKRPCMWVYLYNGHQYPIVARNGDEALAKLREMLSAKAGREAILMHTYPMPETD